MLLPLAALILADFRIVPGDRIGSVRIGMPADQVRLGKAAYGDGAAGHAWSTYLGKSGHRVDLFTALGRDRPQVWFVRVTSPSFRLANGLHPGSSEASFRRTYPQAKDLKTYRPPTAKGSPAQAPVHIFAELSKGLTFEVQHGKCIAVGVAPKADPYTGTLDSMAVYLSEPLHG